MNEVYNPTVLMVPVHSIRGQNTICCVTSMLLNAIRPTATVIAYLAPIDTTAAEMDMVDYVSAVVDGTDHRFTTILIFYECNEDVSSATDLAMDQNMDICGEALRLPGWPVTSKVVKVKMTRSENIQQTMADFYKTQTCMDLFTAVQVNEIRQALNNSLVNWAPNTEIPADENPAGVWNSSDMDHYAQCEAAESM